VTTLKLSGQGLSDIAGLEQELVTAVADRLRDEHGYQLGDSPSGGGSKADHEYRLLPAGGIVVHHHPRALMVKLRGVDVDARDLFTGVSSQLEQRHDGLGSEIR
jgi:hypothetical protein